MVLEHTYGKDTLEYLKDLWIDLLQYSAGLYGIAISSFDGYKVKFEKVEM